MSARILSLYDADLPPDPPLPPSATRKGTGPAIRHLTTDRAAKVASQRPIVPSKHRRSRRYNQNMPTEVPEIVEASQRLSRDGIPAYASPVDGAIWPSVLGHMLCTGFIAGEHVPDRFHGSGFRRFNPAIVSVHRPNQRRSLQACAQNVECWSMRKQNLVHELQDNNAYVMHALSLRFRVCPLTNQPVARLRRLFATCHHGRVQWRTVAGCTRLRSATRQSNLP